MVIGLLDGRHLPETTVEEWSQLQLSEPTLASPFFRPEFTTIVAECRADVRVAVLDGGGFFPFQRGRMGAGLPVGSRLSDYHGLVAPPDRDVDAGDLLRACGLGTWEFDGLLAAQRTFAPFHRARRSSPVIDVADGYEAYRAARRSAGSTLDRELARKAERLSRRSGPLRFEPHVDDAGLVERLVAWKSAQYARTGAVDVFAYGWVRDVVRRVHETQLPSFAGMLSVLYAGDEPVAMHLGLRSASVWHWWFPAYDPTHGRESPGSLLLERMAQAAPGLGLTVVDLGKGDALYKTRFANDAVELATGTAGRPSLSSAHRVLERAMNVVLYRTPARAAALRGSTRRRFR